MAWERRSAGVLAVGGALALAGCGGGDAQDENEPVGTFPVRIVKASFPTKQRLSQQSPLEITVRNAGAKAIPNVSLSIGKPGGSNAFSSDTEQRGVADPQRPVWIIDDAPTGGNTAYVNTWALGRVAPGASRTFRFRLTAARPGSFTVDYRVSAGLDGKAKARLEGGGIPEGSFRVAIAGQAPNSRVDPKTGRPTPGVDGTEGPSLSTQGGSKPGNGRGSGDRPGQ